MKVLEDFFESLGIEEEKEFLATDGMYYKVESGLLFTLDEDWLPASIEKHIQLISGEIKPVWKPKDYEECYIPYPTMYDESSRYRQIPWFGHRGDEWMFENGLVFQTKEEAIAVANEMLKVTKQD